MLIRRRSRKNPGRQLWRRTRPIWSGSSLAIYRAQLDDGVVDEGVATAAKSANTAGVGDEVG